MDDPWYYQRSNTALKAYVKRHPPLYRFARAAKFAIFLGPLRGLVVRFYRRRFTEPPTLGNASSLFAGFDVEGAVEALSEDGIATGLRVPAATLGAILAYCDQQPAHAGPDRTCHIDTLTAIAPPVSGAYVYRYLSPHETCEAVRNVAFDPTLLRVAQRYFGGSAIMYDSEIYWSFPNLEQMEDAEGNLVHPRFHYESGDFMSLIVFIYLSDVDGDSGPHVMIKGTHRHKSFGELMRGEMGAEEAQQRYGDRLVTVFGPQGSGFIEDPAAYHRRSATREPRLMLAIHYFINRRP